jgi:hypothetical protein
VSLATVVLIVSDFVLLIDRTDLHCTVLGARVVHTDAEAHDHELRLRLYIAVPRLGQFAQVGQ